MVCFFLYKLRLQAWSKNSVFLKKGFLIEMLTLKAVYFFSISNQMGCWLSHLILICIKSVWNVNLFLTLLFSWNTQCQTFNISLKINSHSSMTLIISKWTSHHNLHGRDYSYVMSFINCDKRWYWNNNKLRETGFTT